MNIAVGFGCLVVLAVLEGVAGLAEQQLSNENQIAGNYGSNQKYVNQENYIERRRGKTLCRRRLDGRCVRRRKSCPGYLPSQTAPGKPYCSKFHRCCHKAPVPVPECPSPWILIGHQCFRVVGRTSAEWRNWASARTYCEDVDGDLAQPSDIKALADYIINENYSGVSWFWLGGSDLGREGDWTWANGSTIASTGWYQDRPDNADGTDCLAMWPNGGANSLHDFDCGRAEAFVCERY